MTDLWKAVDFLSERGYEFVWESPDGRETVWRKGDIDVSLDETREWADIMVPLSDLPSFLSGLTLEMVETAVREALTDPRCLLVDLFRTDAVDIIVNSVMERLRQQMGGEQ